MPNSWVLVLQELWNSIWVTWVFHPDVKCHLLKHSRSTCSSTDLAWPWNMCISRSQRPRAARKEMPHSRKFWVTKQQTKSSSFNAYMTHSGHLTLHWTESMFSTEEYTSRKAIKKVVSARALGLPLCNESDNYEPQLQMYHFLTNNHLTLLMPPKEKLS